MLTSRSDMEEATKRKRGRPQKDPGDGDYALARRRTRIRLAQQAYRRRKEDVLRSQARKIVLLERAIEDISNTFVELSDTMIQSSQLSETLVLLIQGAMQKVLSTVKNAVPLGKDEGADEDLLSNHEQEVESIEAVLDGQPEHIRHEHHADLPFRSPTSVASYFVAIQEDNFHFSQQHWRNEEHTSIDQAQTSGQQCSTTTEIFYNSVLPREYWAADYSNYNTSLLPGDNLPSHLDFWQRLLRISIASGYHALRGDPGYPTERVQAQYRFSISVRPVGFILASARQILRQAEYYDHSVAERVPVAIQHLFDNEETRIFGRDAKAEMLRLGECPDDYIDASEVAEYLNQKGQFYYDGEVMKMVLSVPDSAKARATKKPVKQTVVRINVQGLIERLTSAAICMGDMVGYPKAKLNAAIVASVFKMAG